MERAPEQCILCGSAERSLLFRQGEWTVFKCTACGLAFLDPRPSPDELSRYYERDYFDSHYDQGLRRESPEMRRRLSQEQHRIRFIRRYKKNGHLLDIGCGMGYFLYACSLQGFEVEGMDISDASTAYIRAELGLDVKTGTVDRIGYEDGRFDIITMWHFLEHSPDPRAYLESASRWLKDDGILVVDVPNHESTDARNQWPRWTGWSLPYHFYHFTPATLAALLARYGFTVIAEKKYLSESVKEGLERTVLLKPLARVIARCFSGHSIAVIASRRR